MESSERTKMFKSVKKNTSFKAVLKCTLVFVTSVNSVHYILADSSELLRMKLPLQQPF